MSTFAPEDVEGINTGDFAEAMVDGNFVNPEDLFTMKIKVGEHYELSLLDYMFNLSIGCDDFLNKKMTTITIGDKQYSKDDVTFLFAYVPQNK